MSPPLNWGSLVTANDRVDNAVWLLRSGKEESCVEQTDRSQGRGGAQEREGLMYGFCLI